MVLEVEVKARVPSVPALVDALADRGAEDVGTVDQADTYFAHPCRDLVATDEAVRLRVTDAVAELTWKGPRLDAASKTRREATVEVVDAERARTVLDGLGFEPVATVTKRRSVHRLDGWIVCIDEVDGLEPFVEIERTVAEAMAGSHGDLVAEARALLDDLGAGETERRSYLEMLLGAGGGRSSS